MTNSNSRRSFIKKSALAAGFMAPIATYAQGLETALDKSTKTLSKPSDLKITEIKCGYIRNGHSRQPGGGMNSQGLQRISILKTGYPRGCCD